MVDGIDGTIQLMTARHDIAQDMWGSFSKSKGDVGFIDAGTRTIMQKVKVLMM